MDMKRFEQLTNLNGVSGYEHKVRKFMKEELSKYTKEIVQDKLGSIFGIKKGDEKGPVVMIAGHMDEVGAMVTNITESGFLKIQPMGSISADVMISQNVSVLLVNGEEIKGVVGSVPPHLNRGSDTSKAVSFDELLVDIGAENKAHAIELGVRVGTPVVPVNQFYMTADGKKVVAKAWDNRFGCGIVLEVMKELQTMKHPNVVVAGATVQEEVGLRGAQTASQMIKPDLFLAVDVSPVGDFLSGHPKAYGKLGDGFLIRFYDPRCIMNPALKTYFEELAIKHQINHQYFLSMGGTDAAAAQFANDGTLSTTVGLPGRYIHSTTTMVHVDDMEAVKQMVLAIIRDFDWNRYHQLLND